MSKIQLSKNFIISSCKLALNEDLYPLGDITSDLINNKVKKKVKMISNQNGVLGGIEFARETFKLIDKKILWGLNYLKRIFSLISYHIPSVWHFTNFMPHHFSIWITIKY